MNDGITQFALRETHAALRNPRSWAGICALTTLLALSGPFGTDATMQFWPRLAYWFSVVAITFFTGTFIHNAVAQLWKSSTKNIRVYQAIAGVLTGFGAAIVLLLLNWVLLGIPPLERGYTLWLLANVVGVSVIVSFIIGLTRSSRTAGPDKRTHHIRLLDRLEFDKRGLLVSLSVQDHYVEVVTTQGASLLLMRLSDAIAETKGADGLQVHRSHWIARQQVKSCNRTGDRVVLTMLDGRDIPVSRTYVKAVRNAGLLPRSKGF